jgi:hypothetical protein
MRHGQKLQRLGMQTPPHRTGHDKARCAQPVNQMLRADPGKENVQISGQPPRSSYRLTQHRGDFLIREFLLRRLEQHAEVAYSRIEHNENFKRRSRPSRKREIVVKPSALSALPWRIEIACEDFGPEPARASFPLSSTIESSLNGNAK